MTREQFITYVESTQKSFRRFLVALCCGDDSLADDIAQEAFIKAYLSCDSFNSGDKFSAWIYRIGYNTFLNCCRSRKISVGYDEAVDMVADETADRIFRYQELYAALYRRPAKERMSLLLFYLEGYSIGGKTATSQTLPRSAGKYISSFIGFAPADDPQILGMVIIHDPQGIYYGGTIAAPVLRDIYDNVLPYLGIEKK